MRHTFNFSRIYPVYILFSYGSCIFRLLRIITDYKYWKASELKHWFLYYSLTVVHPILPYKNYKYHKLLVAGITYFLSHYSVSPGMPIIMASNFLSQCFRQFPNLYGRQNMIRSFIYQK